MGLFRRITLFVFIVSGLLHSILEFHAYGVIASLKLFILFILSSAFLWGWASGVLPAVGKLKAIMFMMGSALVGLFIINYALANDMNVDMAEVIRMTVARNPWFYLLVFVTAGLKVFLWRWMFAGVKARNDENNSLSF